jgi:hypothetical protein
MRSSTNTVKFWVRCFYQGLRQWCGDAAYERYLISAAKSGTMHPLCPSDFYVEQANRKFSRPNRCC